MSPENSFPLNIPRAFVTIATDKLYMYPDYNRKNSFEEKEVPYLEPCYVNLVG